MKKEELALALGMGVQQLNELLYIGKRTDESGHATYVTNFAAAEGLRKRGLVSRYTRYVVGTDWADERGVHSQWRQEKPMRQHEWYSTAAGDLIAKFIKENTTA